MSMRKNSIQSHSPSSPQRRRCSSRSVEQHVSKTRCIAEPATSERARNVVRACVDLLARAHSRNDLSQSPPLFTSKVVRLCCFPLQHRPGNSHLLNFTCSRRRWEIRLMSSMTSRNVAYPTHTTLETPLC